MQVINLDLSVKGVIPFLQAKQGDVGRKFQAVITDGGAVYNIPIGTTLSIWYSGTSGEGNYSDIGGDDSIIGKRSAFDVSGNTITVEMIAQMLSGAGGGTMCLVMNGADGTQIATWNIPYIVEKVPGANSEGAKQYYTAYAEAAVREMSVALERALQNAKESGEFDGPRGIQGEKGEPGEQGVQGEKGEPGEPGADGKAGEDGISVTHSWNGTTLIVTSASGTSSADLKGDKGDAGPQGEKGETGEQGPKGDTGATGPAYILTDADKSTIAAAVKASLTTENWTFTLEGGSTVTKAVYVG